MRQNRLFNRTRIQLTGFYAIVIGLITLLSGSAIHLVMIRAFERTNPTIQRFYHRVQADRSRNTGGTGLDLAIVRAIVCAHHGSIQVDSQLDLGSRFTVSLPIKVAPSKISSHQIA